jgi:hypothetical protein
MGTRLYCFYLLNSGTSESSPDTKEGRLDPSIMCAVSNEIHALLEACNTVVRRARQGGKSLVDLTLNEKYDFVSPPPTQKKRRLNDDSANKVPS